MINQQQGSAIITSLLLLSIIFSFILLSIKIFEQNLHYIQTRNKHLLCLKQDLKDTQDFIEIIVKYNFIIKNAQKLKYLSALFPPLRSLLSSTKIIKAYAKKRQSLALLLFLKERLKFTGQQCPIRSETPSIRYNLFPPRLIRDSSGAVKLSNTKEWKKWYFSNYLRTSHSIKFKAKLFRTSFALN